MKKKIKPKRRIKAHTISPNKRVRRSIFDLVLAGQGLSNIAFNWSQNTDRPEAERKSLKDAYIAWDAARDKVPRWVHSD